MSSTGTLTPAPSVQNPRSVVCCEGIRVWGGMKATPGLVTLETPSPGSREKVGKIAR